MITYSINFSKGVGLNNVLYALVYLTFFVSSLTANRAMLLPKLPSCDRCLSKISFDDVFDRKHYEKHCGTLLRRLKVNENVVFLDQNVAREKYWHEMTADERNRYKSFFKPAQAITDAAASFLQTARLNADGMLLVVHARVEEIWKRYCDGVGKKYGLRYFTASEIAQKCAHRIAAEQANDSILVICHGDRERARDIRKCFADHINDSHNGRFACQVTDKYLCASRDRKLCDVLTRFSDIQAAYVDMTVAIKADIYIGLRGSTFDDTVFAERNSAQLKSFYYDSDESDQVVAQ